jgi:DNA invertase Pin-like site-specific DNA recombinase
MRAALYARVSTATGQDPAMQLRELRDYCGRLSWEITGEFVDAGFSGSAQRRPQLDRLFALARKAEFNAVVVYRYDRFVRAFAGTRMRTY